MLFLGMLYPKPKVEMRPIRFPRGKMLDTFYLCERESNEEDEETVLKRLRSVTARTQVEIRKVKGRNPGSAQCDGVWGNPAQ
jgi:hypothetical protein